MTGEAGQPLRLSKILAQRGIASRSEADRMIERGWVSVNGRVALPGDRALPDAAIELSPEALEQLGGTFTVVLNKPRGFVSAPDETGGARAMSLLVPENYSGLGQAPAFSTYGLRVAGRLAVRDAGLVVYTTDTALARRLAASDVSELWRLDFEAPPPATLVDALLVRLSAGNHHPAIKEQSGQRLVLHLAALGKGDLAACCEELACGAAATRLQRGEIVLPAEVGVGQWQLAGGDRG